MIIRMKRNSPVLDVLLPRNKQLLLAAILLQPERSWYLNELARHLSVSPSSLQRELAQFVAAGIVTRSVDGNRVYYQADRSCPVFKDLSATLAKTIGLAEVIRDSLEHLKTKIDVAIVYGSIASGTEHSASDVDLMIVGRANLADLSPPLRTLEEKLGRAVNVSVYTTNEFLKKIKDKNHFLHSVLETELVHIIGTADDLARLVERVAGSGS